MFLISGFNFIWRKKKEKNIFKHQNPKNSFLNEYENRRIFFYCQLLPSCYHAVLIDMSYTSIETAEKKIMNTFTHRGIEYTYSTILQFLDRLLNIQIISPSLFAGWIYYVMWRHRDIYLSFLDSNQNQLKNYFDDLFFNSLRVDIVKMETFRLIIYLKHTNIYVLHT